MESVISAVIILFLLLFAAFTLGETALKGQQTVYDAWQDSAIPAQVNIELLEAEVIDDGDTLSIILSNSGPVAIAEFPTWDVLVEYYDAVGTYFIEWLNYAPHTPLNNEWTITGIYSDAAFGITETFDPDILNPGEQLVMEVHLSPAVGVGEALRVMLFTEGAGNSLVTLRNTPPTLETNDPLVINQGETGQITSAFLRASDTDDTPEDLMFTVISPLTEGELSHNLTFTQAMVDAGRLDYDHYGGTGDDLFKFTITDGVDTIGPFTFVVEINEAPVLMMNNGVLVMSGGVAVIGELQLMVTDADNPAGEINYSITTAPVQGTLSLGPTFTQEQVNLGGLVYTHTGMGSDQFSFVVSDGYAITSVYTFVITVM